MLVERGANLNARDVNLCTPLLLAVYYGHTRVVKLLMVCGADTSASDAMGKNALRVARNRRDDVMVATLQGLRAQCGQSTPLLHHL